VTEVTPIEVDDRSLQERWHHDAGRKRSPDDVVSIAAKYRAYDPKPLPLAEKDSHGRTTRLNLYVYVDNNLANWTDAAMSRSTSYSACQ
jgi:RHS repeat-associated protein